MVTLGPFRIDLVPTSSRNRSLAARASTDAKSKLAWDLIKGREFARAGYRCEICRANWRLECNEMWTFDDVDRVQTLIGYEVVCPACDSILHIDRTIQAGETSKAATHFAEVTGLTEADLRDATAKAIETWRERSTHTWQLDLGREPLFSGPGLKPSPGVRRSATTVAKARPPLRPARTSRPAPQKKVQISILETNYLKSQRLARIATASRRGVPEVSPVGFEFDGKYFWVGSHDQRIFFKTQRYRNIKGGSKRVSLVIDDLVSVSPWRPRGMKVSGYAEVMPHEGIFGKGSYFRITPLTTVSWGIEKLNKGQWVSRKVFQKPPG